MRIEITHCWFESQLLFFKVTPPLYTILLHCTCTCASLKSQCVYVHVFSRVTSMKFETKHTHGRSFFLWESATFCALYCYIVHVYMTTCIFEMCLCLSVLSGRVRGIWNQTYNLHPLPGHGTGPCLHIHVETWLLYTTPQANAGWGQTDMQW